MDVPRDPLYVIFEKHLNSGRFDRAHEQELIDTVVEEYLLFLTSQGVAQHRRDESWRTNIEAEVSDMLKMKIYGHFSLRHYLLGRRTG